MADGALLEGVPFSALANLAPSSLKDEPLIASHSLRFLPTERLLLVPQGRPPERRFLGVADPIYNVADARRLQKAGRPDQARAGRLDQPRASRLDQQRVDLLEANESGSAPLARLVGSDREIRSAAKIAAMPDSQILVGPEASGATLSRALKNTPEVLHFAVHVVSPPGHPQEAALALSLTPDGLPELLTPEAIAAYRVPGTLVVLSGCSSEQGKVLPSAGLIGLSRAWLLAGASAVIVSAWPTPDDSGQFFSAFYSHFQACKMVPSPKSGKSVTGSPIGYGAKRRLPQLAFLLGGVFDRFQGVK